MEVRGSRNSSRALYYEPLEERSLLAVDVTLLSDFLSKPGVYGLKPTAITEVNGVAYFAGETLSYGRELWRSDGTEGGTFMISDIWPGTGNALSTNSELVNVGGVLYFDASDGSTGRELWKSDGTPEGTVQVADGKPGMSNLSPDNLTAAAGRLYFTSGSELWVSDGSREGTTRLTDVAVASDPGLTHATGTLFFRGDDGVHGVELWKTDGTQAGTIMVKDIYPGSWSGYPQSLVAVDGLLSFRADTPSAPYDLYWQSDGTSEGTFPYTPSVAPTQLTYLDDAGYFVSYNQLRRADGSVVFSLSDKYARLRSLISVAGDALYFISDQGLHGEGLWRSDGTVAGTSMIKDFGPEELLREKVTELTAVSGVFFLRVDDEAGGNLWKSDGTAAGTARITTPQHGTLTWTPKEFLKFKDATFFFAKQWTGSFFVDVLWRSDGTRTETIPFREFGSASNPSYFTIVDDYFVFNGNGGLWRSDGTVAGTALIKEWSPRFNSGLPMDGESPFAVVNGVLYFESSVNGAVGLWKSDGTTEGTVQVAQFPHYKKLGRLVAQGDRVYFAAYDRVHGYELWTSDGTPQGTERLTDLWPGPSDALSNAAGSWFTAAGGSVYFAARSPNQGVELWRWDETHQSPLLVQDIGPGVNDGVGSPWFPRQIQADRHGTIYFTANDGAHGWELWKTDGSSEGTVLVKDIYPGPGSAIPDELTLVDDLLYFTATTATGGRELWRSDGTAAGTYLVMDIVPGAGGSTPKFLKAIDGQLFFAASTDRHGDELWSSDGTAAGTQLLADFTGDAGGSAPEVLAAVDGRLFVAATTQAYGREIWIVDLDAAPPAPGDYSRDGQVDGADFLAWQRSFGLSATPPGIGADGNGDGFVGGMDLSVWSAAFSDLDSLSVQPLNRPYAPVAATGPPHKRASAFAPDAFITWDQRASGDGRSDYVASAQLTSSGALDDALGPSSRVWVRRRVLPSTNPRKLAGLPRPHSEVLEHVFSSWPGSATPTMAAASLAASVAMFEDFSLAVWVGRPTVGREQ